MSIVTIVNISIMELQKLHRISIYIVKNIDLV